MSKLHNSQPESAGIYPQQRFKPGWVNPNAVAFIRALGLQKVDVLGYSIGGFVTHC